MAESASDRILLTGVGVNPHSGEGRLEFSDVDPSGALRGLTECFANMLRHPAAPNYVGLSLEDAELGSLRLTLQRCEGKTPEMLHQEVTAERDALLTRHAALIAAIDALQPDPKWRPDLKAGFTAGINAALRAVGEVDNG